MLYGHRPAFQAGNRFMAHRGDFRERCHSSAALQAAGFARVASLARPTAFDLWALASCQPWSEDALRAARQLFPQV